MVQVHRRRACWEMRGMVVFLSIAPCARSGRPSKGFFTVSSISALRRYAQAGKSLLFSCLRHGHFSPRSEPGTPTWRAYGRHPDRVAAAIGNLRNNMKVCAGSDPKVRGAIRGRWRVAKCVCAELRGGSEQRLHAARRTEARPAEANQERDAAAAPACGLREPSVPREPEPSLRSIGRVMRRSRGANWQRGSDGIAQSFRVKTRRHRANSPKVARCAE